MSIGAAWIFLVQFETTYAQNLAITEFLAINDNGHQDADGDTPDWFEVGNLGNSAVSLDGIFATDDAENLAKWRFPDIVLDPGELLVVFASGKNRAVAGQELHTNFGLGGGGEYLALVDIDGQTVLYEYSPTYPPQRPDVSFGLAETGTSRTLVTSAADVSVLVPTNGNLDLDWTLVGFNDNAWIEGTNGVGFDTDGGLAPPPGEEVNLARDGTATQSSQLSGFSAALGNDGDFGNFTHTHNSDQNATWEVDLGGTFAIASVVLHNRQGCCNSRLRDITVRILNAGDEIVFESDLLNAENVLGGGGTGGPSSLRVDLVDLVGSAVSGRTVRVSRTPDPDLSGSGGAGNADEGTVLSLGEVEVFEGVNGFSGQVQTDLENEMLGVNASAYVRIPFSALDAHLFESLRLRMKYDDGFVAYLNGVEVARANAPGVVGQAPAWNAGATEERDDSDVILVQEFDISDSLGELREGSNVLAIHGLNRSRIDGDFLLHAILVGFETSSLRQRYFETPTPGGLNDESGVEGFVSDTMFSIDRGFYDDPIDVEIMTETEGAFIRYTTDGSSPTATRGTLYSGPVRIDETTILRAAAFKDGFRETNVDTHSYFFLDDVISSSVMRTSITNHATYGPQMEAALTDLPSISLVTAATVSNNEVPTSVEWIDPNGGPEFQEDAGVKWFGGNHTNFAKKNFRIFFRGRYGDTKLRFPAFEGFDRTIRATDRFDQIELRSGSHDMNQRGFYMSNRFCDDTMLDMGNVNPHGRFVHMYLDGTYWGQFHLRERFHDTMFSEYDGGEPEDYESINGNRNVGGNFGEGFPYDGDGSTWEHAKSLRNNYAAVKDWVNLQCYIDFMILWCFGNSESEYRAVGPVEASTGFKFYLNDADGFTRGAGNRTGNAGPGGFWTALRAQGHPDYMTLLGDRIHEHLYNDGALTPAKTRARLLERCDQVRRPFYAEAARWGYRTPSNWESTKNNYVNGVLPGRSGALLNNLRGAGMYPRIAAPVFSEPDGLIEVDTRLTMTADAGTVYFTADGSDPRRPGGAVSPTALEYSNFGDAGERVTLVASGDPVRVLVPTNGTLGLTWTDPDFNDGGWRSGRTGVGYETGSGYADYINLDVEGEMDDVNGSCYLRLEFDVEDRSAIESLALGMRYDDGFLAYLNGQRVADANLATDATWNSTASASHADNIAITFEQFDLTPHIGRLRNGRNVLAIHGANRTTGSSDFLIDPQLVATLEPDDPGNPNEHANPLVINRTSTIRARARVGSNWSALNKVTYVVDSSALRITELMYHPPEAPIGSDFPNRDDHEFIELQNTGDRALNLSGIRFVDGIRFTFPETTPENDLQPGEFVLLVKDIEAFASRYDVERLYIAGEFDGNLGNAGDRIVLEDSLGRTILDFTYEDTWYPDADGLGSSLEILDPEGAPSLWRDPDGWAPSDAFGGTPGEARFVGPPRNQLPGDANGDSRFDVSDAVRLLRFLFLGQPAALPCGDGSLTDASNRALLDMNGDDSVELADAVSILGRLFQQGPPHPLGETCVHLEGCPDTCP